MTHRPTAPANFDRVARLYRWMEYLSFGKALERCRNYFLPQLVHCRTALVLGDGDGRFLTRLLSTNRSLHADAVDTSLAMLRVLTQRAISTVPNLNTRLHTHQANALNFAPARQYDLIVTHFFLDCLTQSELDALALRLAQHSMPQTLWLVSDFRIPQGCMRWPARAIIHLLYLAFGLLTGLRIRQLPDHASSLIAAGFHRQARHLSLAGLLTTELWTRTATDPTLPYNIESL